MYVSSFVRIKNKHDKSFTKFFLAGQVGGGQSVSQVKSRIFEIRFYDMYISIFIYTDI